MSYVLGKPHKYWNSDIDKREEMAEAFLTSKSTL